MNFEKAFTKYREGNATPEEKEYVENELCKAKALSNMLDDEGINVTPAPIVEADKVALTKAKKNFKWKIVIFGVISVISVLVIIASIMGGVFGAASSYASKKIKYDEYTCSSIALNYVAENEQFNENKEDLTISNVDTDFEYELPLKESFYAYKVSVKNKNTGKQYLIYVHTITGDSIFLR